MFKIYIFTILIFTSNCVMFGQSNDILNTFNFPGSSFIFGFHGGFGHQIQASMDAEKELLKNLKNNYLYNINTEPSFNMLYYIGLSLTIPKYPIRFFIQNSWDSYYSDEVHIFQGFGISKTIKNYPNYYVDHKLNKTMFLVEYIVFPGNAGDPFIWLGTGLTFIQSDRKEGVSSFPENATFNTYFNGFYVPLSISIGKFSTHKVYSFELKGIYNLLLTSYPAKNNYFNDMLNNYTPDFSGFTLMFDIGLYIF